MTAAQIPNFEAAIADLRQLQDGWLDGEGKAPTEEGLAWVARTLRWLVRQGEVPPPYLYPTPEGGAQAEWPIGPWEVSITFHLDSRTVSLLAVNTETQEDIEEEIRADAAPNERVLNALILAFISRVRTD